MEQKKSQRPTIDIDPRNIASWNQTQTGQLILVHGRAEKFALYLRKLHRKGDLAQQRGLWDIYARADKNLSKDGYWLCRISKFDRNSFGEVRLWAKPVIHLGEALNPHYKAWKYLFQSGQFSSEFTFTSFHDYPEWNFVEAQFLMERSLQKLPDELKSLYADVESVEDFNWEELAMDCFKTFGMPFLTELEEAFGKPDAAYLAAVDILKSPFSYKAAYPSLIRVFDDWRAEARASVSAVDPVEAKFVLEDLSSLYGQVFSEAGTFDSSLGMLERAEKAADYYEQLGVTQLWIKEVLDHLFAGSLEPATDEDLEVL